MLREMTNEGTRGHTKVDSQGYWSWVNTETHLQPQLETNEEEEKKMWGKVKWGTSSHLTSLYLACKQTPNAIRPGLGPHCFKSSIMIVYTLVVYYNPRAKKEKERYHCYDRKSFRVFIRDFSHKKPRLFVRTYTYPTNLKNNLCHPT